MSLGKKLVALLLSQLFVFSTVSMTHARSLYVITDHTDSDVSAYKINNGQISYQTQMDPPLHFGNGAVGLALDPGDTGGDTGDSYEWRLVKRIK